MEPTVPREIARAILDGFDKHFASSAREGGRSGAFNGTGTAHSLSDPAAPYSRGNGTYQNVQLPFS